jgi:hypothetical protein
MSTAIPLSHFTAHLTRSDISSFRQLLYVYQWNARYLAALHISVHDDLDPSTNPKFAGNNRNRVFQSKKKAAEFHALLNILHDNTDTDSHDGSYKDRGVIAWHIQLLQDAVRQLSNQPNLCGDEPCSPSLFNSDVKELLQSLSNIFLRGLITAFKNYTAVYISHPSYSHHGSRYRHSLRLGQSRASFSTEASILLSRRRKNHPLHPHEIPGTLLTVFSPMDGKKCSPPARVDFSRECGCLIALAQEYFVLKPSATDCMLSMVSVRPYARVAIVSASVRKEYLEALEAGGCPPKLEICVSRLYDMKEKEDRVRFAGVYFDMMEVLVNRRVTMEVVVRKEVAKAKVPAGNSGV